MERKKMGEDFRLLPPLLRRSCIARTALEPEFLPGACRDVASDKKQTRGCQPEHGVADWRAVHVWRCDASERRSNLAGGALTAGALRLTAAAPPLARQLTASHPPPPPPLPSPPGEHWMHCSSSSSWCCYLLPHPPALHASNSSEQKWS
jgi:hypothetical protein